MQRIFPGSSNGGMVDRDEQIVRLCAEECGARLIKRAGADQVEER
jgi:hypothetical protein